MSAISVPVANNNKVLPVDKSGLPWEIWQIILSWLSARDLCHFALVCKTWSELVISVDSTRWRELYLACSDWRHPFWPLNVEVEPPSWRLAYRDQHIATRFWKKRQKQESKHRSCRFIFKKYVGPKNIHVGPGMGLDSLNAALAVASPYDRIIVHPGIYDEQFEISAKIPFELIGHGEIGSVILVISVQQLASTTRFSNLVLRAPWYTSFIVMINSGFLQMDNCIVENGMICAQNPSTLHIKFCTFRHATIVLQNMNTSIIENCEFSQSKSANIIIEGYPKETRSWTYTFLKERTNAIYQQNRSLHRKKLGLKSTASLASTLQSSFTTKSVSTMQSALMPEPITYQPTLSSDDPGASFLNPGLLVPLCLGSEKDVSVGCGDLQSMYQEHGRTSTEPHPESQKQPLQPCGKNSETLKLELKATKGETSNLALHKHSSLRKGSRHKSADSHVGFHSVGNNHSNPQDIISANKGSSMNQNNENNSNLCLSIHPNSRSQSFSTVSATNQGISVNNLVPESQENNEALGHTNSCLLIPPGFKGQDYTSLRKVCSESNLHHGYESSQLTDKQMKTFLQENFAEDSSKDQPGPSRLHDQHAIPSNMNRISHNVILAKQPIHHCMSVEIDQGSSEDKDSDISSISGLDSAAESNGGAIDAPDSLSSSGDSSDTDSVNYTNSDDFSSSEESVIMLPHLQDIHLDHPGMIISGPSYTSDTDSISSECTRPVPVNISEDTLMSSYVGQIQGCLIHQCRMNHSKGGIVVSLQAHAIISECDISNVSYGIRCIQNSRVVILKNKIHHCQTSGIFMRLGASGLIAGNDIHSNNEAGIDIRKNSNPLVQYNQIHHGKRSGIVVLGSGRGQILKNDIYCNTEAGVYILFGGNPTVRENYIYDGRAAGVAINAGGKGCILDNVIRGNKWGGVDVRNGSCPLVSGNSITNGVSDGIVVGSGGKGIIENNYISGNAGCGLWLLSAKHLFIHGNRICDSGHCGIMLIDMMSVGIEGFLEQSQFIPNLSQRMYSENQANLPYEEPDQPYAIIQYNTIYRNKGQGIMVQIDENIRILYNAIHENQLEGICMSHRAPAVVRGNSVTNNGKSGIVTSTFDQVSLIGNGIYNNQLFGLLCRNESIVEENDIISLTSSAIKVESSANVTIKFCRLGCSTGPAIRGKESSILKVTDSRIYYRGSGEFISSLGEWTTADNIIINHTRKQSKNDFSKSEFLSDPNPRPFIPTPPPFTIIPEPKIIKVNKVSSGRFCDQRSKLCRIL